GAKRTSDKPLERSSYRSAVPIPAGPPLTLMGTPGVSVLPSKLNTWSSFCTMHWTSNVLLSLLQAAP
ncbi:MAG: hypothetical protein WB769_04590, partial [Pseudolabrys sp.]